MHKTFNSILLKRKKNEKIRSTAWLTSELYIFKNNLNLIHFSFPISFYYTQHPKAAKSGSRHKQAPNEQ